MTDIGNSEDLSPLFEVGDTIECDVNFGGKIVTSCEIVAVLPPRNGDIQYRVKNKDEAFERMVAEYQLVPVH